MAKIIMVQGTASNVGKSVLTTALCRIFTQDGYKTAPFKSQNMTTVCHTLGDGRKMARSQAIAAYACKCEPSPDMNPVLLLMGENGTEVISGGESMGIMSRNEYKEYKKQVFNQILAAFNRLSETNDVVVIEGAGSPVELNLNKNDIVNMGLAKAVNAPVLLVSDIVRGGVFASVYGTMALLTEDEKRLVKGLVINKFKGNTEHFKDGVEILESLCNTPVLGVIPYIDVRLEDEDSLTDGKLKTVDNIMNDLKNTDYKGFIEAEFDRIAAHFRANLNMDKLYQIIDGGA
jgi:adenosylcobyric acid synthase